VLQKCLPQWPNSKSQVLLKQLFTLFSPSSKQQKLRTTTKITTLAISSSKTTGRTILRRSRITPKTMRSTSMPLNLLKLTMETQMKMTLFIKLIRLKLKSSQSDPTSWAKTAMSFLVMILSLQIWSSDLWIVEFWVMFVLQSLWE